MYVCVRACACAIIFSYHVIPIRTVSLWTMAQMPAAKSTVKIKNRNTKNWNRQKKHALAFLYLT